MATHDQIIPSHTPPAEAPRILAQIKDQERTATLPSWNATIAFQLGCALRTRLLTFEQAAVIHISSFSTPAHVLFHSVTHSGTALDNDYWVARKRNAVIRFGCSTWLLQNKYNGDEELFAKKVGLGGQASEYAIHGGGVPLYVKNCDHPVAVVVVSGLKQWDDHQVVIEEIEKLGKVLYFTCGASY